VTVPGGARLPGLQLDSNTSHLICQMLFSP